MPNPAIQFHRTTAVPASPVANAVYYVNKPDKPDYIELYVANSSGALKRIPTVADIIQLIAEQMSANSKLLIVDDIAARDALQNPTKGQEVFVVNATGDTSVKSGGARYVYNESWLKISETESMDVSFSWESLTGKPTSTPAQIDNAVNQAHTHNNLTQLNKIGEDEQGNLTYAGKAVKTSWDTTAW